MTDAITTTAQLIEQGYLVPTQVFARPAVLEHELHTATVVEAYQSTCAGKRVIVFVNSVLLAEYLAAQFNAAGILAYAVLARDNNAARKAALEAFTDGNCLVLITINVDLSPAKADGIIVATPHNSARRFEHQVVSAMRPRYAAGKGAEGTDAERRASIARSDKPVAMIIDLADNVLRHPDVIASVTHRAKPDTHLTIPGSLEWDQSTEAPATATPARDDRAEYEAAFKQLHPGNHHDIDLARDENGAYKYQPASVEWPVWLARAALDRSPGGAGEIARLRAELQELREDLKVTLDNRNDLKQRLTAAEQRNADDLRDAERYRKLRTVTPYRFKRMQDASVTDGGDVLYFHSGRFDVLMDAELAKPTESGASE